MIKFRPYQIEAINHIYDYFQKNTGNPIVAMPTGTGKSIVITYFIKSIHKCFKGQKIILLTHVKEIIDQDVKTIFKWWPTAPIGIYSASHKKRDTIQPIIVAGIASVNKKANLFEKVDLILIDECHLVSPNETTMYRKFISELQKVNPALKIIGFTATDYRLGSGKLINNGLFTDVCYDLTHFTKFNKLIEDGYLAPLITKKTKNEYDLSEVTIQHGEYNKKELQSAVDKSTITKKAIEEVLFYGKDRNHWLFFATGITHCTHIAEILKEYGISTTVIHSKISLEQREEAITGFKTGKYKAAVNANILTTGFDFPELDLIAMMRPTKSPVLWVQALGRGTRPAPNKKDCLILDFGRNIERLGPINDPVLPKSKNKQGGGIAPIKLCEQCNSYIHASYRFCPKCGSEFPIKSSLTSEASTKEILKKIEDKIIKILDIVKITYNIHKKKGKPDSLKIIYWCGLVQYIEWICIEHENYAGKKARDWWRMHNNSQALPQTTKEAFDLFPTLKVPYQIKVWVNTSYPQIEGYVFH